MEEMAPGAGACGLAPALLSFGLQRHHRVPRNITSQLPNTSSKKTAIRGLFPLPREAYITTVTHINPDAVLAVVELTSTRVSQKD